MCFKYHFRKIKESRYRQWKFKTSIEKFSKYYTGKWKIYHGFYIGFLLKYSDWISGVEILFIGNQVKKWFIHCLQTK